MSRVRALGALLGCLAVLAGSLTTVAAAAVPSAPPATERSAAVDGQPCGHCDECGTPCPAQTTSCAQACMGVAPSLAALAPFVLPASDAGKARWASLADALSGLAPPPDPFPPRS